MSVAGLPEAALILLPLAVAGGLDTYLALLFLGVAPWVGWTATQPGHLGDLASIAAVVPAAALYLSEVLLERVPWVATVWSVANTPVRMVAAGLLCLLVVQGLPDATPSAAIIAPIGAGMLAGAVHVARTGWWLELELEAAPRRVRLLTAVVEDAVVVALLYLALDEPPAALILAVLVLLAGSWRIRPHLTAGLVAHGLVAAAVGGLLTRGRWRDGTALPRALRAVTGADDASVHAVRSTPAAAWGPGIPGSFRRGWLVVGLGGPAFVHRIGRRVAAVELDGARASRIRSQPLHTVVDLVLGDGRPSGLVVPRGGPGPEALGQVFDPARDSAGTLP